MLDFAGRSGRARTCDPRFWRPKGMISRNMRFIAFYLISFIFSASGQLDETPWDTWRKLELVQGVVQDEIR